MKLICVFALSILFSTYSLVNANCSLPTDEQIKQDIVGHLQSQSGDAGTMFTVTLSEPVQYTCLAQGTVRDTYTSYSVIANFTSVPSRPTTLVHYQRKCNSGTWGAITGDSFETNLNAVIPNNLQPPTRINCFVCTNQLGDPHHCRQCDPPCPGSGKCTDLGAEFCCSYFATDGTCTDNCTTSDGPNYIADISTNFTCTCNLSCSSGEAPNSDCTTCELSDICIRYIPCQNGGTCTLLSAPDNYTCTCAPGYTGENCTKSISINHCNPNPCQNEGYCIDDETDGYICDCANGFTGTNCSINIDDCNPNPCVNGSCQDGANDYTCNCVPGYTDKNCSTNINECDLNPCKNNGTCFDGINGYTCNCVDSFTGTNCSISINYCDPNPCENGGSCFDGTNDYTCDCVDGFTGTNCSTNINDCDPNPCVNASSCQDEINDYTCNCVPGYTDKNCSTNINDCNPNPCQNGGVCADGLNDYNCICKGSWSGDQCQVCSIPNCILCSSTFGVCVTCNDSYHVSSNTHYGSCVPDDCSHCNEISSNFQTGICTFYCNLENWLLIANACGSMDLPNIKRQNLSLSYEEQWKAALNEFITFQSYYYNESQNKGLSNLQTQPSNAANLNTWVGYLNDSLLIQEQWQRYAQSQTFNIIVENYNNITNSITNLDTDTIDQENVLNLYEDIISKWKNDLKEFNNELGDEC